jgi:hypothetical protein
VGGKCDESPYHVSQSHCDVDVLGSCVELVHPVNDKPFCRLEQGMASVALEASGWERTISEACENRIFIRHHAKVQMPAML